MRVPGSGWRRVHLDQGLYGRSRRGGRRRGRRGGSHGCGVEESGRGGLERLGLGEGRVEDESSLSDGLVGGD
jgi:hypothetical protein